MDAGQGGGGGSGGFPGTDVRPADASINCDVVTAGPGVSPLWLEYAANPNTHTNVPNVSYAGYHNGEVPLPSPAGPIFHVRDARFGAKGDGVTDDTAAIRAALAAASGGGVVDFADGQYLISGVLFVHSSNTVLRGQSRTGTTLIFTKSLRTGYAANGAANSVWSWAGGLIWFVPKSNITQPPVGPDITNTFNEDWLVGPELARVNGDPKRGEIALEVTDATRIKKGDFLFVTVDNPKDQSLLKHLSGDGTWAARYDWSDGNSGEIEAYPTVDWVVEVAAVTGNRVTLKQPLRFDLRPAWNPRLRAMGDTVRESGIEQMTIVLKRDYKWSFAGNHLKEPGWNGPLFNLAINCFARAVTVVDPDIGFGVVASKNITLSDIRLEASGPDRMDHHHGTTARELTYDLLIENFVFASKPWHGINTEKFSMGNVWSNGRMEHGTFDTHRQLPYESVRTNITVVNDGTQGGASNAGPQMGARFVNWNIQVSNNRNQMVGWADIMPLGALVGVQGCAINNPVHATFGDSQCRIEQSGVTGAAVVPANLHTAQRQLRLCGH